MTTRLLKFAVLPLLVSLAGCNQSGGEPNLTPPSTGPRLDKAVWQHHGAEVTAAEPTATATEMVADPKAFAGEAVVMRGTVDQVCQSDGCWLYLSDGENKVFIDTKHKFTLPRDCVGMEVAVEGTGAARKRSKDGPDEAVVVATGVALSGTPGTEGSDSKMEPKQDQAKVSQLDETSWSHFGDGVAVGDPTATASEMVADPKGYEGKSILMRGKVEQVCQSSGCWIFLSDGDKKVFIDTKHQIELPRDCVGMEVAVQGTGATRKKPRSDADEAVVIATGIALKKG